MDLTDLCVARWQEQYVSPLRRMKVNESSTSTGYISQSVVHKPWASDLLWAREGIKNADSGSPPWTPKSFSKDGLDIFSKFPR